MAETFPLELPDAICHFQTLDVVRTFWEKVTILHALHHSGKLREGMSRHYYDTVMLLRCGITTAALTRSDLLERVVLNKTLMFADKSAQYNKAVLGTLRTVPTRGIITKLKQDYAAMAEMFMIAPPSFDELLKDITELEKILNRA